MEVEILINVTEWKRQARAYAESKYAYGDLVDEYDDDHIAAICADETPEYWVERIAEKFNLDPKTNGWN